MPSTNLLFRCPFASLPNLESVQDRILVQRRSRPLTLFLHSVAARRLTYKGIVRNFAQRGAPIVLWRGFSASVLRFRLAFSKPRTARRLPLLLSLCALVARGVRTDVGQLLHGGRCCGGAEGPCVGFTFVELQNICSFVPACFRIRLSLLSPPISLPLLSSLHCSRSCTCACTRCRVSRAVV